MPEEQSQGDSSQESKKAKTKSPEANTPLTEVQAGGAMVGLSAGGTIAMPDDVIGLPLRRGGITLDVGTDITSQLDQATPAFGNVLMAVGNGVAASQKALDKSVVDTVKKLSDTKITVVTQVVEELNDDGIPDPAKTKLITNDVSVLNYFTPTFHEWEYVNISMDLAVGAFHAEQGVQFSQHQSSTSAGGAYTWGFGGWFNAQHASSDVSAQTNNQQDVAWMSGQCLIEALLAPRRTGKLPVPASVTKGPQIYVTQGAVAETKTGNTVTDRSVDLTIELRKTSGEPMQSGVNITLDAGTLLPSFTAGSATDAFGKVKVTLKRSLSGSTSFQKFPLSILLGSLRKPFTVTL